MRRWQSRRVYVNGYRTGQQVYAPTVEAHGERFGYCIHCERAYPWVDGERECPYRGCDGSWLDRWRWSELRENHPEWPEVPVKGVVYPMYG